MGERNLDFDRIIERRGTDCLKYDRPRPAGMPDDMLSFWVADMDFRVSSYIQDALTERVAHGIFGYTEVYDDFFEPLHDWMLHRHGWEVKPEWLIQTPGVVYALAMAVKAYTHPGEAVLIQQPVYYPFSEVIEDNGRRLVNSSLCLTSGNRYEMDFDDLEEKIRTQHVRLFLLCNPHNPGSRAWTREELIRVGELCLKYDVIVVSDEIHEDFVFTGAHQVFANLRPEFADISITCTSPSKTFNLAGLQISDIFIPNPALREAFRLQNAAAGYSQLNTAGLIAARAAYRDGGEWYEAMIAYVRENIRTLQGYIAAHLPQIHVIEPEATYLVWLDLRGLHLSQQALSDLIIKKAGLWLDDGAIFGADGVGFERINAACPRSLLLEALGRLERAVHEIAGRSGSNL